MTSAAARAGGAVVWAAVAAAAAGAGAQPATTTTRIDAMLPAPASADGNDPGAMTTTRGLTAIAGIEVGHHTLDARPTGCTVVLTTEGATAAVDVRGASPGTRETALLDPRNSIRQVHAVVLSGGSAFGLAAADGVMRYLDERGVGYRTRW